MKLRLTCSLLFLIAGCKGIVIENTNELISFETGLSIRLVNVNDKTVTDLVIGNTDLGFHSAFWINEYQLGFLFEHYNVTLESEYPLGIYDFNTGKIETRFNLNYPIFLLRNATRLNDTSIVFSIHSFDINIFYINSLEVIELADLSEFGLGRKAIHMRIPSDNNYVIFTGLDSIKYKLLPRYPSGYIIEFSDSLDDLYLYNTSEKTLVQLTKTDQCDRDPTWSPNGKHIAFSSNRSGNYEIYVMDKDGKNTKQLTDEPAKDTDPEYSPLGDRIAFVSGRSGRSEIWIMNSDGSNLIQLTNPSNLNTSAYGPLSWSPVK